MQINFYLMNLLFETSCWLYKGIFKLFCLFCKCRKEAGAVYILSHNTVSQVIWYFKVKQRLCIWYTLYNYMYIPVPVECSYYEYLLIFINGIVDQYQYLGNCPPTPPLTQH